MQRIIFNARCPNTQHGEAMPTQKPITPPISLALFQPVRWWTGKFCRVSVPVIAINLNHKPEIGHKKITNQIINNSLRDSMNTYRFEDIRHFLFRATDKESSDGVVSVQRFVAALNRTKAHAPFYPAFDYIELFLALDTGDCLAGFSGGTLTPRGAKPLAATCGWLKFFSAKLARFFIVPRINTFALTGAIFANPPFNKKWGASTVKLFAANNTIRHLATFALGHFGWLISPLARTLSRAKPLSVMSTFVKKFFATLFAVL